MDCRHTIGRDTIAIHALHALARPPRYIVVVFFLMIGDIGEQ
jgi:hypothetical protein